MTQRRLHTDKGEQSRPRAGSRTGGRQTGAPGGALVPALRDRLIQEMDGARIPDSGRLQYLCSMTGRKPQSVRRWIETAKPGLPDLESFAALCDAFDADANWLLGLTKTRYRLPQTRRQTEQSSAANAPRDVKWIDHVAREIARYGEGCETFFMPGDDMEPRIPNGSPILVDTSNREILASGTYLLEYQSRIMVREVESRIGVGLVLRCENPKYKESVVKDESAAKRMGLKVVGRVEFAVTVCRF